MAKGQKRSTREPKKLKESEKSAKKEAGPRYLRESEVLQAGKLRPKPPGQKS
jgi:hypothetical protein